MAPASMVYPIRYTPMLLHFFTYIGGGAVGPTDAKGLNAECGRQIIPSSRIAGGEDAIPGEFPWMASIRYRNQHYCGGAILSQSWILTAAHCFRRIQNATNTVTVKVGGHRQNLMDETEGEDFRIDRVITHPDFTPQFYVNDVALVRLRRPIRWNMVKQPVCLPDENELYIGREALVSGWGIMNEARKGGKKTDALKKLAVKIVDNRECTMWYREANYPMTFQPVQLCAGYKEGGKDACEGDSGGPLVLKEGNRFKIVGIISSGVGCARPLLPGLYTRVSSFVPWILKHTTEQMTVR